MSDDLKTPWHLRQAKHPAYSDVFDREGSPVARVCQETSKGHVELIRSAPILLEFLEACEEFRDAVLHERHQLAEMGMDNDQVNAVLGLYDDTIGNVIEKAEGGGS